jgi:hypothetical protein
MGKVYKTLFSSGRVMMGKVDKTTRLGFRGILVFRLSPYILRGERMATISRNSSSFGFPIFPSYFP